MRHGYGQFTTDRDILDQVEKRSNERHCLIGVKVDLTGSSHLLGQQFADRFTGFVDH